MAELSDVLGSILRDVAHARVVSDTFSRDISREYERDVILRLFPVPRVEIRDASIDLRFAVNAVRERPVDMARLVRSEVSRQARRLADEVYSQQVGERPERRSLLQDLGESEEELRQRLAHVTEQAMLASPRALDAALGDNPASMARRVSTEVARLLFERPEVKRELTRERRVTEVREDLRSKAADRAKALARNVRETAAAAEEQALSVDVAVTTAELAEVPEAVMSRVGIVAEIRNYEWVEVGEVDGQPVRRLRPL